MSQDPNVLLAQELAKLTNAYQEHSKRLGQVLKFIDGNPVWKAYDFYKIYPIDTTKVITGKRIDVFKDFGNRPARLLIVLGAGAGVWQFRINGATNDAILGAANFTLTQMEITDLFYDVVTGAAGLATILVAGWIKS